jgi:hypothetical protein
MDDVEEVTITMPLMYAKALHEFVTSNLVGKGEEGANAVLTIIKSIAKAINQ